MHTSALLVFCLFFALVTVAGFWAARWHRPADGMHSLEEWGLAGRGFGTWITWFLLGGDLYTAYTVIAVPAALYGAGANGFFAIPYTILVYPYMMLVLPRLWTICHRHGYITFADFVRGRYNFRPLTIAIALTGILALMPYIALQLVGMRVVIAALGIHGEWPLAAAFIILAAYTYSSGLRAPAIIAIVKDTMLTIMVLVAIIYLPYKLDGYAHIFALANAALKSHTPAASTSLAPSQFMGYSTLAIGSAIALMLYPHIATGVLSAKSAAIVRRNAAMLPAYSFLLGAIALLGYIALAAGVVTKDTSLAVPLLFLKMFPEWFAGFCLSAIAVGALVPAAIMSIAASNLFTRNLWGELRRSPMTPRQESSMAKLVSLIIKFGALLFVLKLPAPYAIEMQLLGGIWIAQLFPSVILGAFNTSPASRRPGEPSDHPSDHASTHTFARTFGLPLHPWALFTGWAVGMSSGTAMALSLGLKSSVYRVPHIGGMYAAVPALILNLVVAITFTAILRLTRSTPVLDTTDPTAYTG